MSNAQRTGINIVEGVHEVSYELGVDVHQHLETPSRALKLLSKMMDDSNVRTCSS